MPDATPGPRIHVGIVVLALLAISGAWVAVALRRARLTEQETADGGADGAGSDVDAIASRRPVAPRGVLPLGGYLPRKMDLDSSGFGEVRNLLRGTPAGPSLREARAAWEEAPFRRLRELQAALLANRTERDALRALRARAALLNYAGDPRAAYESLEQLRARLEKDPERARRCLYGIIFFQGVTALRTGEDDNCIHAGCRTDCSCILPLAAEAVHRRPEGARLAVHHFKEYLEQFPGDLEVQWLLNLAHMALGEHPAQVDPRFLLKLTAFQSREHSIGRFTNVADRAGVARFNQAGGAILEDFDGDGLLDLAVTSMDPAQPMALYQNQGDGRFDERSLDAGVSDQLGGLNCVQADYDNDGLTDIFVPRGAWLDDPIRPSLLRNAGSFAFVDVTRESGLASPANSNAAQWADYDNDGWLDLFVCCERERNRLYRNRGDGTFEDVTVRAGLAAPLEYCKGCTWVDVDNDRDQDLFVSDLRGPARFYRNQGDGTFVEATSSQGIDGPMHGFSCWSWDYDNDGWLDIFATCYDWTLADVVRGLMGKPSLGRHSNRLFRNREGTGFEDVTRAAGLDAVFAAMGTNFGDFDGDGYMDFYLGTGAPELSMLVPNRMFRNLGGRRFVEVTATSGTGHLQKGHGVACGDWDRDGDLDLFVQTGGAVPGDRAHNVLFDNPGQGNHVLTVRLVGTKTNRSAIGARLKAVTAGPDPLTVHHRVASGSSFGANPLEVALSLGPHTRVERLEVYWPTSDTTQVFRDLQADQVIRIVELEDAPVHLMRHTPVRAAK
jgi:hypothetical protein